MRRKSFQSESQRFTLLALQTARYFERCFGWLQREGLFLSCVPLDSEEPVAPWRSPSSAVSRVGI